MYIDYQGTPFLLEDRQLYTVHVDGLVLRVRDVEPARLLKRAKEISREEAVELAIAQ